MADSTNSRVALYAAVGPELTHYEADVEAATLTRRETVILPANVQYCWPHASRKLLYVGSSDSATGRGAVGTTHHVTALAIDPASGALSQDAHPMQLPSRPIHLTTDIPSQHLLVAFPDPSELRVYRLGENGAPGAEMGRADELSATYAHQVRVTPDNRKAIVVDRGRDPAPDRPEMPGALRLFDYRDGQLMSEAVIAPKGGHGFGPRHLDFHPTAPWLYVLLEGQNELAMFAFDDDGSLEPEPRYRETTLANPGGNRSRQAPSTAHVHPNGRTVYVANRGSTTTSIRSVGLAAGGDNTIAAFSIDPATGEPMPIQHIDSAGLHCRTFHIDPSGQLLVAAHLAGPPVRSDSGEMKPGPACLSLFRIANNGTLGFVRKYDIEAGERQLFWMGMVAL
jgi:6-phosphogluconolactonase